MITFATHINSVKHDINKFKNVILVLTKRDILPKSVKDEKIIFVGLKKGQLQELFVFDGNKVKKVSSQLLHKNGHEPTAEEIAEELAKLGHNIDRKIIVVKGVKEVGSYTATVKLHKEVSVEIPFEVVAEAE